MKLTAAELLILIRAKDEARQVLQQHSGTLKDLGRQAANISPLLKGVVVLAGSVAAAIGSIGLAINKLGIPALKLRGIKDAFYAIGEGQAEMLKRLQEGSLGVIKDTELMRSWNQAKQLVSKTFADTLPEAMKYLGKVSLSTGADMNYLMDSLVRGVGRVSPLILDNLGIQVSLEEATARAAKMFGVEAESLSKAQVQAGMTAVVMEKLAQNTADLPDLAGTAAQSYEALGTTWANLMDNIGMTMGPFIGDVSRTLTRAVELIGPTLERMSTGFWETLRQMGRVALSVIRGFAEAMGIDFDSLAGDAQTWGENIVISLANGMAAAISAVFKVLNEIGRVITEWLEPGSPPKLLPEIDKWGRKAIEAYLGGMKDVSYEDAQAALAGIQYFFEHELRPINLRLGEIRHERADIQAQQEMEDLRRIYSQGLGGGFADPTEGRLVGLRLEELDLEMKQRDLEAERDTATTAAQDRLTLAEKETAALKDQVGTMGRLASITDAVAGATEGLADKLEETQIKSGGLNTSFDKLTQLIADRFQPVIDQGRELGETWGGAFGIINQHLTNFEGWVNKNAAPIVTALKPITDIFALMFGTGQQEEDLGSGWTISHDSEDANRLAGAFRNAEIALHGTDGKSGLVGAVRSLIAALFGGDGLGTVIGKLTSGSLANLIKLIDDASASNEILTGWIKGLADVLNVDLASALGPGSALGKAWDTASTSVWLPWENSAVRIYDAIAGIIGLLPKLGEALDKIKGDREGIKDWLNVVFPPLSRKTEDTEGAQLDSERLWMEGITSPFRTFEQLGKDIPKGLAAGIAAKEERQTVLDAVDALGTDVIANARMALMAQSPSLAFRDIGLDVDAGLILGLVQGMPSVMQAVNFLLNILRGALKTIQLMAPEWRAAGVLLSDSLKDGIMSKAQEIANAAAKLVRDAIAAARSAAGGATAGIGATTPAASTGATAPTTAPSATPPSSGSLYQPAVHSGGYATGTPFFPGGWAMVGEQGPELAKLPTGTRIYDNSTTNEMMETANLTSAARNAGGITVVVQAPEGRGGKGALNQHYYGDIRIADDTAIQAFIRAARQTRLRRLEARI